MRGIGRLGSALRGSNSICPVELGVVALLNWSPPSSPSLWLSVKIFDIPCKDMMCRELRESSRTRLPVLTDLQHAMTAGYEDRIGPPCDETKILTNVYRGGKSFQFRIRNTTMKKQQMEKCCKCAISGALTNCNLAPYLPAWGPQDELVLQEWEQVGQQAPGRRTWSERHSLLGGGQSWGQQSTSPCWAGNKDKFPFEKRQRNPNLNYNVIFLQI